jgi:aspartate aminotransferase
MPEASEPRLAARVARAPVAAATQMSLRARALAARGVDVISLSLGEPDFASPPRAIEAGHAAALAGDTKYPPQDGAGLLKAAVLRKFAAENDLRFEPDEVAVSNGGKQAIFNALMATVEDGDEVVIPAPYWGAYPLVVRLVGGAPVFVACREEDGFRPRPQDVDAAITPRTKWLMLNSPNNPTGAALSEPELVALAAVMRRHPHVWIMCDDLYEHLRYDGAPPLTLARVAPDLRDRTLTICGVSKTYAMTGWRIGFYGGPARLVRAMVNMQGQATAGVCTVAQAAAAAALDGPQESVAEQRRAYQRRRDLVTDALNACEGIVCRRPEGAFYVFPSVAGCIGRTTPAGRTLASDADMAEALLEEAHVAVVHGASFGMSPYLRISYATDDASLAEACRRIQAFCAALR